MARRNSGWKRHLERHRLPVLLASIREIGIKWTTVSICRSSTYHRMYFHDISCALPFSWNNVTCLIFFLSTKAWDLWWEKGRTFTDQFLALQILELTYRTSMRQLSDQILVTPTLPRARLNRPSVLVPYVFFIEWLWLTLDMLASWALKLSFSSQTPSSFKS